MRVPVVRGVIDRRILVNYHVDPTVLSRLLPPPFEPKTVSGKGLAGICLIRLKAIRPKGLPQFIGISSENAAHRIAVQWHKDGQLRQGVYIHRRDSSSRLNSILGGRLFPGLHHFAHFLVAESPQALHVSLQSSDGAVRLLVEAHLTENLQPFSVFHDLHQASRFFQAGSLGYSPSLTPGTYDALELRTFNWHVLPLQVERVHSSFFQDPSLFPPGSIEFDSALLMKNITHEWHGQDSMYCEVAA